VIDSGASLVVSGFAQSVDYLNLMNQGSLTFVVSQPQFATWWNSDTAGQHSTPVSQFTNQGTGIFAIQAGNSGGNALPGAYNNAFAGTILSNLAGGAINTSNSSLNNLAGAELINDGAGSTINLGGIASGFYGAALTFENNPSLTNDGAGTVFYNRNGATVNNYGSILNQDGAVLTNTGSGAGIIMSNQVLPCCYSPNLNNSSVLNNLAGALLSGTGAALANLGGGTLTNDGAGTRILLNGGSTLTNDAESSGLATNIYNQNGAALTLDNSTGHNTLGATLTNTGAGTNFFNQNGSTFTNDTIENNFSHGKPVSVRLGRQHPRPRPLVLGHKNIHSSDFPKGIRLT
jgi:hypothetical protein